MSAESSPFAMLRLFVTILEIKAVKIFAQVGLPSKLRSIKTYSLIQADFGFFFTCKKLLLAQSDIFHRDCLRLSLCIRQSLRPLFPKAILKDLAYRCQKAYRKSFGSQRLGLSSS